MYPDPAFESIEQLRRVISELQESVRNLERDVQWLSSKLANHGHYEQGHGR